MWMYIFLWDEGDTDTKQALIFLLPSEERNEKWDNNFKECLAAGWESRGWGWGVLYLVVPFIADCLLRQFAYSDTMEVFLRLCNLCKELMRWVMDALVRPWTVCGREVGLTVNCAASELKVSDRCLHLFFCCCFDFPFLFTQHFYFYPVWHYETELRNWFLHEVSRGGRFSLSKLAQKCIWLKPLKSKMFSSIHVIRTKKCG